MSKQTKGCIHIYTGTGKGKTTAALGLGLRACGHGWHVYMIQFMKGQVNYGELSVMAKLENWKIKQFGRPEYVNKANPDPCDVQGAEAGFAHAREVIDSDRYDLIILDEIICAIDYGLLDLGTVIQLVKTKPERLELVLTGRNAPQRLLDLADYVTNMQEIKHPFQQRINAREGVEF
ncbi:MAG TPA: cob(I)yrinic acid a,c-diamide adenosyltransferase [bacterium]|nr:cob(I)yrinic acid a,c-diamide adenosyltransferase [bacterium]